MPTDLMVVSADSSGALFGAAWPSPRTIDGEYNLVQRIYKNLLTNPGDDQFDPEWGSGLQDAIQGIPGQSVDLAAKVVTTALQKAVADIQAAMGSSPDPNERLRSLHLDAIVYDYTLAVWRADVTVETDANIQVTIQVSV